MGIVDFDFMPTGSADPYPVYERMRDAGPVLRSPFGALMVHRYDDVRDIHGDFERFSMSAMGAMAGPATTTDGMAMGGDTEVGMGGGDFLMAQTMLTVDPPDHERLRRVVNRAFTPRSIAGIEPRVREVTRELLAPLADGEPFDIVADFAGPLPTIVISELLGIPADDAHQFRMWTDAVTGTNVRAQVDAESSARYGIELRRYLANQIELRKGAPSDDLIGRMVEANTEQIMTDAEVVAACVLLLVAGNETTMRLITNMTLALGRFPDQLERLVDDPELITSGVEEAFRYDSPVQMLFRGVTQDTAIGDVEVTKGQMVLTMLGAANRDPAAFDEPDRFDVGRDDNMHVALGHGIHYCLGAPLARRETRIAFEELIEMAPRFTVLTPDDELDYPPTGMLRSPRSLVVGA